MARKTGHLCPEDEKFCTCCTTCRPLAWFQRRGTRDKLGTRCSTCREDPEYIARERAMRRRWALKKNFNVTPEWYDEKLAEQGGGCAICGETDPAAGMTRSFDYLHIDHNHKTGENRGILCSGCNVGIGHFGEDPERLEAAARYLRSYMP